MEGTSEFDQELSPTLSAIVDEIGDDEIIAERVLSYVRIIKKEVMAAKLRALYSEEEIQQKLAVLDREDAEGA